MDYTHIHTHTLTLVDRVLHRTTHTQMFSLSLHCACVRVCMHKNKQAEKRFVDAAGRLRC